MSTLRTAIVIGLVGIFGCGSSDHDADLATMCEAMTRTTLAAQACLPEPTSTSEEILLTECKDWLRPYLEDGSIQIAPAELIAKCEQAAAASCTAESISKWENGFADCRYFTGMLTVAKPCSDSIQAERGSFCLQSGSCGVIVATYPDGAACQLNSQCSSSFCTNGICTPKTVAEGGACSSDRQCPNMICAKNKCAMTAGLNGDCSRAYCERGLSCKMTDANYRCVRAATNGQACDTRASQTFTNKPYCVANLACTNNKCMARATVGAGATCGWDAANCDTTSWCNNNTCVLVTPPGGACINDNECGPYGGCMHNRCTYSSYENACYVDGLASN